MTLVEVAGPKAPEILSRIVSQIVNEAAFALEAGVGSPEDADTAMRLGFNWPLGPVEWATASVFHTSLGCWNSSPATARPIAPRRLSAPRRPGSR